MQVGLPERVRFGAFEFDLRAGELRKGARKIRLQEQPFQVLRMLVEQRGAVVTREEIKKKLWPNDTVVEFDHSIQTAISKLRQALGDSADHPKYIETVARRGYRLMIKVEWQDDSCSDPTPAVAKERLDDPSDVIEEPQLLVGNLIGRKFSHYRILEVLGGGGMGVVYKAEDLRLGRAVAIKFLGEECSGDHRALERFEREARTISVLDHLNICTIYEVDEDKGQPFIVMQLLQGQTLRQRIESAGSTKSAFSQGELLDFAIQIVTGLEAAHQKGIIHRDVKPANIFITHRGEIKLLDFGLAKLVGVEANASGSLAQREGEIGLPKSATDAGALKVGLTLTGGAMGTASYMSPEQVRCEPLDARTDLFSFGAVLYEMATGCQPFRGDSADAIHHAILNDTPPSPSALNPDLPAPLEPIIRKTLEKDREKRYQSASELSADLKRLERHLDSGQVSQVPTVEVHDATTAVGRTVAVPAAHRLARQIGFLFAAFALLVAMYASYRYWHPFKAPTDLAKVSQISHWNKPMDGARLSPDGRMVAFSSPVGIVEQVFVMLASGGDPLQVTRDEGDKYVDNFSSDGTEIYYGRALGDDEGWAVPTLGGTPRWLVSGCCLVSSVDGNSLFYLKSDSHAVFRAAKSDLNEEKVYSFDDPPLLPVSVLPFPNGNDLLVAAVARVLDEQVRLYKLNLLTRTAADLDTLSGLRSDLVWGEPGKTLLLSRTFDGLTNLWKYSLTDRTLTQITSDPGPDLSPMPAPIKRGIYYVNGKSSAVLTTYHVRNKEFVDLGGENASQPVISPDGKRVMYVRFQGPQKEELWVSNLDGTNKIRLASSGSGSLLTGGWAPDGSQLAFSDGAEGFVIGADGNGLRSIGKVEEPFDWITWSADAKWLYLTTWKSQSARTLWRADLAGSKVDKFLDEAFTVMDVSPDGQYLLGSLVWGDAAGIYQISLRDKKRILLLPGVETEPTRFAADGKSFAYAEFSQRGVTLHRQAWRDGELRGKPELALKLPFASRLFYAGNALDFSRDLSEIVYARLSSQADLYLLKGAR